MDGAQLLSQEVQRSKEEVSIDMKRIESGKGTWSKWHTCRGILTSLTHTHNHLNWFENMTGSSVLLNRHVHIQVWEQKHCHAEIVQILLIIL